jgi:hypothetical protein
MARCIRRSVNHWRAPPADAGQIPIFALRCMGAVSDHRNANQPFCGSGCPHPIGDDRNLFGLFCRLP